MLSKTKIAYIRSLHNKAIRLKEGIFLVEGLKCMGEFLGSDFEIVEGFFTGEFAEQKKYNFPHQIITESELGRITTLMNNDSGVLLVRMKNNYLLCHPDAGRICPEKISGIKQIPRASEGQKKDELILVLDRINDPGNLGTIIRIADWYGVSQIIASRDTVDCYNPKVLMATMGSFTRVSIFYTDLEEYLISVIAKNDQVQRSEVSENGLLRASQGQKLKIYGAYLDGESTHTKKWSPKGRYLVIGSEAHGISDSLEKYITDKVTIPRFGSAESLNAGVATAVILDRMRGDGV